MYNVCIMLYKRQQLLRIADMTLEPKEKVTLNTVHLSGWVIT